jgi:hypothetical protein
MLSSRMICRVGLTILLGLTACLANAQNFYVTSPKKNTGDFTLSSVGKSTSLLLSTKDFPGVIRAAKNLKTDIGKVTDVEPEIIFDQEPSSSELIIIGTIGVSPLIDQLVNSKKLNTENVSGKWESFIIETIEKPFPKVDRALVIAGSDKRGTTFGIYEVAKQIGVSPWYWWADVPVKKNKNIFASSGRFVSGEPAVKYRGIFLNDEEPALGRWAVEKYGGFTHEFYEKVFELLLRLKGNFLWPAMWWAAFNADDPLNASLADEYGIVMSTSHHEPMMRAHAEWRKLKAGDWNYETNAPTLQKFWREGIERMGSKESIVTLAMRGDGDMAMSAETKTALLEKIVKDQRDIIADVTKKEITKTPQVWAIYKEVQDYYDKGMRVPDDVTLLFCDDNWGNIRKLPNLNDKLRVGGYGIYYHFDYVGDPRNYKWLNTNPITKIWEQMHMAYEYGVDRIWIVNVGDLKPMEFPISFFLDYAWNPKKWNQNNLQEYTRQWCEDQFGKTYANDIADIISKYTKYNSRRKPELLSPDTYSLANYHEAETIVSEYRALEKSADEVYQKIEPSLKDAFYQLVLHPVKACANLNDMYVTLGRNKLYAVQGRSLTNELAERAKDLYKNDSLISVYYNKTLSGGKWNNMMNQIHIGYTYWQDPKTQVMPETKKIEVPNEAEMGIAVEGSDKFWTTNSTDAVLPEFNLYQNSNHYFEIFNRGKTPFDFSISSDAKWLKFSKMKGTVKNEERIYVSVFFSSIPIGLTKQTITITANNKSINVVVKVNNTPVSGSGFMEIDHCIAIEPEHFDKAVSSNDVHWQILPDYGRTLSGVTVFPVTAKAQTLAAGSPHMEYNLFLVDTASINVQLYLGATLNYNVTGLRLAVSLDNQTPRVVNIHENETQKTWAKSVEDNMRLVTSKWKVPSPGKHILKYWMIDPGIVLQKIVVDAGGVKPSYLGPPESSRVK